MAGSVDAGDDAPTETTTTTHPDEQQQPINNDLVMIDGFPALRKEDGSGPEVDHDKQQLLPQHTFWAHETALQFPHLPTLRDDCCTVFTARTREHQASYSAGETYFLPCAMAPRCALEALVQSIFTAHTRHLAKGTFVPTMSGAEWWTLVMDDEEEENGTEEKKTGDNESDDEEDDDEVGMHFDADYGLEDQAPGLLLHPRVATVTYLSDFGVPTVVFDRRSPPPQKTDEMAGAIHTGWLSHPIVGKHMAFDGRLLHGAPSAFFPAQKPKTTEGTSNKKAKVDKRRFTLLVNVWLNHCPLDAEPLEEDILSQLKSPFDKENPAQSFVWESTIDWAKPMTALSKLDITEDTKDPAGTEEVVICDRIVTIAYGASLETLHAASSAGSVVHLDFAANALTLSVGETVDRDADDSDDDDEDVVAEKEGSK